MNRAYEWVSSMKTGVVLLVLIALSSAVGSLIKPDVFFMTLPFKGLLLLLFFNMLSCSINRLFKIVYRISGDTRRNFSRLRYIGILLLHAGVVLIIAGGMIYSFLGQNATVSLIEGHTLDISQIIRTNKPFMLRLNKFEIVYYSDGSPSQYYSDISVIEDNKESKRYRISVNHPLQYGGAKAYQQSFGYLIAAESSGPGNVKTTGLLREGQYLDIAGTSYRVRVYKYVPNFDPRYGMNTKTLRPDNPRVIFSVYEHENLLGVGVASFGEDVKVGDGYCVTFRGVKPYTILRVKSDPGLPVAAAGGLILMLGVVLNVLSGKPRSRRSKTASAGVNEETHEYQLFMCSESSRSHHCVDEQG